MGNKITRRHALAAPLALALAACGKSADTSKQPAILLRGNGPDPDSLDPHKARSTESMVVLRDLFEGLTRLDKVAATVPASAESWTVSDDGRLYTFKLRANLHWSNGEPLVAEDFVAGMQRLVNPATASQYAQVIEVIQNAPDIVAGKKPPQTLGVAAPDATTVVITLSGPAPYLPGLMAHPSIAPLHRPSFAKFGDRFARPGDQVSNGAFMLTAWLQGSYIRLARNPHYWNNAANKMDGVKYLQIADENAELRAYRAGELHCTRVVPRGQFDWIKENLAAELHVAPQLSTYYYGFNLDRALFRNPQLRQALSMAIDRERLANSVLRVGELPAYGWVPPGVNNYSSQSFDYAATPVTQRIEIARKLLAEAGFTREKPLRFELRYNSGEVHTKVAVAVASMWKEALGVEASLAAVEFKSLFQDIDRREIDVYRLSWVGDYNDAYTFLQYLKGGFGINLPHYASAAYDALLDDASRQTDLARRRALLEQAERTMLADHPLIPLYFYVNKHLVKPVLKGWYDNVLDVVYSSDLELVRPA
ncbi:MAG TPA: peptide ABC transporter substrate-binding protein [Steroidobacteraceae bacterium]|jgi:oligopeptide transport system substrate-binding protein|nr:peptide ABC transporter substrate-binding protein [Steroidobacteraceae bacterium]